MHHRPGDHAGARDVSEREGLRLGEYRIRTITTGRWREHCYVLQHLPSADAVIVDPGEDAEAIVATVRADAAVPRSMVLTHAHYDHVGALATLGREFGIPFYLHLADAKLLRRAPMYAMSFEGKTLTAPGDGYDVMAADLQLGGRSVRTLHVPGHTEGGMAYGFHGFVFTGDTLMFEDVGRTDLPGGNAPSLGDSVQRLLAWAGKDDTVLLAGHSRPWTAAEARRWWDARSRQKPAEVGVRETR